MKFSLTIDMDNAAFADDPHYSLIRIIDTLRSQLVAARDNGACMDINGNRVGAWEITT